jgi:hypothetical protein
MDGKKRVGEVTGENERKMGAFPDGELGAPDGPRSDSSQQ